MQPTSNPLQELDDYAAREEKAFGLYQRQYARQYPPPKSPNIRWSTGVPWIAVLFGIIAIAGSALAALRTSPVFIQVADLTVSKWLAYAEGFLAMLVIDLGVIAFRYAAIYLTHKNQANAPSITHWVKRGAEFAFGTQLIAQLYAVRGMVSWLPAGVEALLELAIAIAAALSGMVLAFVTGEILAVLALQMQHERSQVKHQFDSDLSEWREGLTKAWKTDRSRYIGTPPAADRSHLRRVSRLTDNADSSTDKRTVRGTDNRLLLIKRPSPAEQEVLTFLLDNPDKVTLTVRELSELTGVNRDAVNKAKQRYVAELSGDDVSTDRQGGRA
jgi:hypothetical protein